MPVTLRVLLGTLALCLIAGGAAAQDKKPETSTQPRQAPEQAEVKLPAILNAKPLKEDPKDDALRMLLKLRYNEAVAEMAGYYQQFVAGKRTVDAAFEAAPRLVQSGLELRDKPDERIALLTQYLELTKEVEKAAQRGPGPELHLPRYWRLDAEIQLLRAKCAADKATGAAAQDKKPETSTQPRQAPEQAEVKLPAILNAKPLKEDPKDDALRMLLKSLYNEAVAEMAGYYEQFMVGRTTIGAIFEAAPRLVQSGLELRDKPDERIALLTQYLELTKDLERNAQTRYDAHGMVETELHRARYQRLDAEIQLLRVKRAADKATGK